MCLSFLLFDFFFFKQKTAYEMRISDWSSDVCSSDLSSLTTFQSSAWTVAVASNTVKPHNTAIRCSEPIIVFLVVDVPDLPHYAAVICSHQPISRMASSLLSPQTSMSASNAEHTAGRSGWPKIRHRLSTDNCTQRSPDRKSTRLNSSH